MVHIFRILLEEDSNSCSLLLNKSNHIRGKSGALYQLKKILIKKSMILKLLI